MLESGPARGASVIVDNWATRPNTAVRVLLMKANQPAAAVLLLPGGHGNLNLDSQGHIGWGEDDFLIRTRWHYFDHGIAAVIPDVAADHKPPIPLVGFRTSEQQAEDLHALSENLRGMAPKVWIVAYDSGATSALNAVARGNADLIAGLVLVSPVLDEPDLDSTLLLDGAKLAMSRIPVLVVAHQSDACSAAAVAQLKDLAAATKAQNFESITVTGGRSQFMLRDPFAYAEGSCNTRPSHALAGLEDTVTDKIIGWLDHGGSSASGESASAPSSAAADIASDNVAPVTQVTGLSALPELTAPGFSWLVIRGLNVQAVGVPSMVAGQPVLRLTATPNDTRHTLAVLLTGLKKNQTYRVAAWVKPVAGSNVEFDALDRPDADRPLNSGQVVFDLYNHQVIEDSGLRQRDIEQHPNSWQKIWIDLATSDGQFQVEVRPAKGKAYVFDGDGKLGLILGGIEVEPLD
jgi:hypothetical protein